VAQLGGLIGVAPALDAQPAPAEEREDLPADLGDDVALPGFVLDRPGFGQAVRDELVVGHASVFDQDRRVNQSRTISSTVNHT
jgi:hypothetical protein